MIIKYIQPLAFIFLVMVATTACNKEVETKMAIAVNMHGYNIGDDKLEVSIDTVVFDKNPLQPNSIFDFSKVYPYLSDQTATTFKVKNLSTGKELFQQELSLASGQLEFFFPLININGKLLEVNPPKPDPATNKLGFYIYYTESDDPIDIFMRDDYYTGETRYLAKNVKPMTWVYVDYQPVAGFDDKNIFSSFPVRFTKAGTTDQWAFYDDEYRSQVSTFGMTLPHKNYNLNKVQPYFIIPSANGWEATAVNLFPRPKNY